MEPVAEGLAQACTCPHRSQALCPTLGIYPCVPAAAIWGFPAPRVACHQGEPQATHPKTLGKVGPWVSGVGSRVCRRRGSRNCLLPPLCLQRTQGTEKGSTTDTRRWLPRTDPALCPFQSKIHAARSLSEIAIDLTETGTLKTSKLANMGSKGKIISGSSGSLLSSGKW